VAIWNCAKIALSIRASVVLQEGTSRNIHKNLKIIENHSIPQKDEGIANSTDAPHPQIVRERSFLFELSLRRSQGLD
jgi:hypothetical protein